jgi:WD40 repeat protein
MFIIVGEWCILDKVGEIWAADLPSLRRKVFLGGHTASVITDVAVSPCSTLVATSDRDEKIKLSQLPSFNIDRYCLGHTNVVTSICFVPGNGHFLCSVGWDFTLCLWDYVTGQLLDNVQFDSSSNRKPSMIVEASIVTDGGLEEEDAAEEERVYDEREAGNFPMKVVVCITSSNSVVAVVMFKGDPVLQLIAIGESLSAPSPLPLTNAPADIVAMSTGELMVLLPKPHYVEVYDLSVTAGAICSLKMVNMIATQANIFCSKEGLARYV